MAVPMGRMIDRVWCLPIFAGLLTIMAGDFTIGCEACQTPAQVNCSIYVCIRV